MTMFCFCGYNTVSQNPLRWLQSCYVLVQACPPHTICIYVTSVAWLIYTDQFLCYHKCGCSLLLPTHSLCLVCHLLSGFSLLISHSSLALSTHAHAHSYYRIEPTQVHCRSSYRRLGNTEAQSTSSYCSVWWSSRKNWSRRISQSRQKQSLSLPMWVFSGWQFIPMGVGWCDS